MSPIGLLKVFIYPGALLLLDHAPCLRGSDSGGGGVPGLWRVMWTDASAIVIRCTVLL